MAGLIKKISKDRTVVRYISLYISHRMSQYNLLSIAPSSPNPFKHVSRDLPDDPEL